MEIVNHKKRLRCGYVRNNPFQMCSSSHDLAPYDLAFSLPASLHATRSSAFEVTYEFVRIRGIRVLLFPIRVHPCASVVKPFRETLHFTSFSTTAKMGTQQLARFE